MYAAHEDASSEDPANGGHPSPEDGDGGPEDRPEPCDGGEVMSEEDGPMGGDEIDAVFLQVRGGFSLVIEFKNFSGDEPAVRTIGQIEQ